jgi:hypothetical protein
MAEFLSDIHVVDLNRSVIDEAKSDKKKGKLFFTKKTYVTDADYKDAQTRPRHHIEWANNDKDGNGISTYQLMGYDFVEFSDPYYPEGAGVNAENHYVFKDAILMKIDLIAWLKRRARDMDKSNKAPQRARDAFVNSVRDDETGEKLGFTEEQLKQMV